MKLLPTAFQTVGPFWHIGMTWLAVDRLVAADERGEWVTIEGHVLDGDGQGVSDALIEVWQANSDGKYADPEDAHDKPLERGVRGFGRVPTDDDGRFRFSTIKPGAVSDLSGGIQAPHLLISVFMRGLLKRLVTRMYFPSEERNDDDSVLRLVPGARRATLIASEKGDGVLEWNIVLQGDRETVFFDC